jgi:chemotaxis regulatin CheY-phosphate phosphatase CheZ
MSEEQAPNAGSFSPARVRDELEKLTDSINVIMDNMRKMQNPILESREQLPQANAQLDKVSAQTEKAANKMLDLVEQIIDHQEKVVQMSGDLTGFFKRSRARDKDVYRDNVKRISEMAATSQNNAFLIMDALQFQDITAQQVNHASSLLEDIEIRLQKLLGVFDGKDISELENRPSSKKKRSFDPGADLFEGRDQKEVDDIISKTTGVE